MPGAAHAPEQRDVENKAKEEERERHEPLGRMHVEWQQSWMFTFLGGPSKK